MSEKESLRPSTDAAKATAKDADDAQFPSTSSSAPLAAETSGGARGGGATAAEATSGGVKKKPPTVQIREPPVSETRGYQVVKVEEKHGPLHRAIPVMPLPLAIICCILNIGLPGIGTLISAPCVFCCGPTRLNKPIHAFGLNVVSSLLQMLTFLVIVGWIWSILWGMTFVQLALSARAEQRGGHLPYFVRRQSSVE